MTVNWADMPETKRLKEFIEGHRDSLLTLGTSYHPYGNGALAEAKGILAEMERLELDDRARKFLKEQP